MSSINFRRRAEVGEKQGLYLTDGEGGLAQGGEVEAHARGAVGAAPANVELFERLAGDLVLLARTLRRGPLADQIRIVGCLPLAVVELDPRPSLAWQQLYDLRRRRLCLGMICLG